MRRELLEPAVAVRFTLDQDLAPAAYRLLVLLDGVPMAVLEAPGPNKREVVVSSPAPFRDLALVLQKKPGSATSAAQATFETIALRTPAGAWVALEAAPLREQDAIAVDPTVLPTGVSPDDAPDAVGGEGDAGPTARRPSASSAGGKGGCSAGTGGGQGAPAFAALVLCWLFGWRLWRGRLSAPRPAPPPR